jgi:hypothetical protein
LGFTKENFKFEISDLRKGMAGDYVVRRQIRNEDSSFAIGGFGMTDSALGAGCA